ncbi:MAG: hypothetical protein PHC51_07480 [bacterium]|nr:hypothetical protein [bacterium]
MNISNSKNAAVMLVLLLSLAGCTLFSQGQEEVKPDTVAVVIDGADVDRVQDDKVNAFFNSFDSHTFIAAFIATEKTVEAKNARKGPFRKHGQVGKTTVRRAAKAKAKSLMGVGQEKLRSRQVLLQERYPVSHSPFSVFSPFVERVGCGVECTRDVDWYSWKYTVFSTVPLMDTVTIFRPLSLDHFLSDNSKSITAEKIKKHQDYKWWPVALLAGVILLASLFFPHKTDEL